jgi:hypothetical protein
MGKYELYLARLHSYIRKVAQLSPLYPESLGLWTLSEPPENSLSETPVYQGKIMSKTIHQNVIVK